MSPIDPRRDLERRRRLRLAPPYHRGAPVNHLTLDAGTARSCTIRTTRVKDLQPGDVVVVPDDLLGCEGPQTVERVTRPGLCTPGMLRVHVATGDVFEVRPTRELFVVLPEETPC